MGDAESSDDRMTRKTSVGFVQALGCSARTLEENAEATTNASHPMTNEALGPKHRILNFGPYHVRNLKAL